MSAVTTAETKRRLHKAVAKIVNEVPIITEEDVAEVQKRIDEEAAEILATDPNTYHTALVKVIILNREVEGPIDVFIDTVLNQRLDINKEIKLEKSSKGSSLCTSNLDHSTCSSHHFNISLQVPSLKTLSARTVNKALGKYNCSSVDWDRMSTFKALNRIKSVLTVCFKNQQVLLETLEIPLDCVHHLKNDFNVINQKCWKKVKNTPWTVEYCRH